MEKRELIDYIREINKTASPAFLATFTEEELTDYLEQLLNMDLRQQPLTC